MALNGMMTVIGSIEPFIEHVVCRSQQAYAQQGKEDRLYRLRERDIGKQHRKKRAWKHENILEPMVNPGKPEVVTERRRRRYAHGRR